MIKIDEFNSALHMLGLYYNKVLEIDLSDDSFNVIKANDREMFMLPDNIKFTDWVKNFVNSPMFMPYGINRKPKEFEKYYDIDWLRSIDTPIILEYQKLIEETYHDMELTILPFGNDILYVYVRDNTEITKYRW